MLGGCGSLYCSRQEERGKDLDGFLQETGEAERAAAAQYMLDR
jgi:hypothetical protein